MHIFKKGYYDITKLIKFHGPKNFEKLIKLAIEYCNENQEEK